MVTDYQTLTAADVARLVVTITGAEALGWENPTPSLSAVGFARMVIEAGTVTRDDANRRPVHYTNLTVVEQAGLRSVAADAAEWRTNR